MVRERFYKRLAKKVVVAAVLFYTGVLLLHQMIVLHSKSKTHQRDVVDEYKNNKLGSYKTIKEKQLAKYDIADADNILNLTENDMIKENKKHKIIENNVKEDNAGDGNKDEDHEANINKENIEADTKDNDKRENNIGLAQLAPLDKKNDEKEPGKFFD